MMADRFSARWALVVALIVVMFCAPAAADKVRCPVCGQIFDEETTICPNDGTDLKLLGEEVGEPGQGAGDEAEEEVEDDGDAVDDGPAVYRRHDDGGARRPRTQTPKRGYGDRRSRIRRERRGPVAAAQQKRREQARARRRFMERDSVAREAFGERRAEIRARAAEEESERDGGQLTSSREDRLLGQLAAPLASLGYRMLWMGEGRDIGPVCAAEVDLNLVRYRFRTGFSTLIGVRSLDARGELVFLESLGLGVQWPARFSPFAIVRGGLGVLTANRFGVERSYLMTSLGAEAGVDAWLTPWFTLSALAGYARVAVDEAAWHSFTFKISVGF